MNAKLATVALCLILPALSFAEPADNKDEMAIRALIEELVFDHEKASSLQLISPEMMGGSDDDEEYKRQFEKCRNAYNKLTKYKEKAFPILIEHLEDKRPSIHFRNHYEGHSVGDACRWNIYLQLEDNPLNYSSYGLQRKGRDHKNHIKPYHAGSPFDDAGGLVEWLKTNKELSYSEMQIKCLSWFLKRETAIGAADADSYFENILPLEIQILKRRMEAGADVKGELERLRKILKDRDVTGVPKELLPNAAEPVR